MQASVQKVYEYTAQFGLNVIAALAIFLVGRILAQLASKYTERAMIRMKVNKTVATFVRHLAFYGMITFVVIAALSKLGVETTSFIAVIGAASLAVGLALQGTLANFASGFMLVLFQPFRVGDTVTAGGAQGRVDDIQIFSTIIITNDGKRVIVPNSKITGDNITVG